MEYRIQTDIFGGASLMVEDENGLHKLADFPDERAAIEEKERRERRAGEQTNLFGE